MRRFFILAGLALPLLSPAFAQQAADGVAPEIATGLAAKNDGRPVESKSWMVSVANPLAAEAAAGVLRDGGTAADAAVAAQAMLGLVEPQSSGLGGGAFVVYFDAAAGRLTTLDARETAPLAATPRLFQDESGEPLKFFDAVVGGRSVGTPGTPKLMEQLNRQFGALDMERLLEPAIERAQDGFAVSPRLAALVAADAERLARSEATAAYFLPDGVPIAEGSILVNEAYANSLRAMSKSGSDSFYTGAIASDIVKTVREYAVNPGVLAAEDLRNYAIKERPPVCLPYRGNDVCGMGPPSSGALTVGLILGMLEQYDLAAMGRDDPQAWRLIGDASRLAFADRGRYMADTDFVPVPVEGLLKPDYLAARGKLLGGTMALTDIAPGEPEWDHAALKHADDASLELPSTSHISIVDAQGNAISMTTTIENAFGSRLMVRGFLLNNELTDFSFRTHEDGRPIANRVEPGKRPRSSMAPTIVMRDGKPTLVIGSPGGSRIIGYVAQSLIGILDWGMDVQAAVSAPHLINRFGTFDIEEGTAADALDAPLQALGYETENKALTSGLHAIAVTPDGLAGAADPRREGIAIGE